MITQTLFLARAADRRPLWALAASVLLVVLADALFHEALPDLNDVANPLQLFTFMNYAPAWTAALFFGAFLGLLAIFRPSLLADWPGRITALACCALMVAMVRFGGWLPFFLLAAGSATLALHTGRWQLGVVAWIEEFALFVCRMFALPFRDWTALQRRNPAEKASRGRRLLRNWIFPLGLGFAFVGLFILANPLIALWIEDAVWDFLQELILPRRLLLWVLAGTFAWAALRPGWAPADETSWPLDAAAGEDAPLPGESFMTPGAMTRALVLFNAIFLVQTAMDSVYLLGGSALPEGFTYAEYAHRGAYPLVATALLAGAVVLAALRPGSATERSTPVRVLTYVWIGQNVFLVFTSAWRLALYIEAYSLTRLRVAAFLWMGLVALGLGFLVARMVWRWSGRMLLNANGLALIALLLGVCFVNVDRMVADFNVDNCREMGGPGNYIDLYYLEVLGPDALPALKKLRAAHVLGSEQQHMADYAYERLLTRLGQELSHWRRWTLRAWDLVEAHPRALDSLHALPQDQGWSNER